MLHTPLTLIFKMGQGLFHIVLCLSRQPILRLWLFPTCCPPDYPIYTTNNCWHSVDAHFHDGTGGVSHSVLPIKVANNSFMTVCNLLAVWLPRTHDQKSLKLDWCLYSRWGRDSVSNRSREPASGPGLDRKNGSVQFQTCPKTRPSTSWWSNPGPVPINPWVLLGSAGPVCSNFRLCISGSTIYSCIQICYCWIENIDIGTLLTVLNVPATIMIKTNSDTLPSTSWKWVSMKRQWLLVTYLG